MTFWGTVAAFIVGNVIVYVVAALAGGLSALIKDRINNVGNRNESRKKIGFGDDDGPQRKTKGTTMRKIGFGEQD